MTRTIVTVNPVDTATFVKIHTELKLRGPITDAIPKTARKALMQALFGAVDPTPGAVLGRLLVVTEEIPEPVMEDFSAGFKAAEALGTFSGRHIIRKCFGWSMDKALRAIEAMQTAGLIERAPADQQLPGEQPASKVMWTWKA